MTEKEASTSAPASKGVTEKLYRWVLSWADTPYGAPALFILALIESSFFPIPPDPLLLALGVSKPKKAYYYAFICTTGSVMGGVLGYAIGLYFIDSIGMTIIGWYGLAAKYEQIRVLYEEYNALVVLVAGVSPIPYKVFTIAAGAFKVSFIIFLVASIVGRGFRFFVEAALIHRYGAPIKEYIERYLAPLAWGFGILIVLGFAALKLVF